MKELRAIYTSERPEAEKLALAFGWITERQLRHAEANVELLRAVGDKEELVRSQIKLELVKSARRVFELCYLQATGRRAWDEQGSL